MKNFFLLILATLFITSCQKEDLPTNELQADSKQSIKDEKTSNKNALHFTSIDNETFTIPDPSDQQNSGSPTSITEKWVIYYDKGTNEIEKETIRDTYRDPGSCHISCLMQVTPSSVDPNSEIWLMRFTLTIDPDIDNNFNRTQGLEAHTDVRIQTSFTNLYINYTTGTTNATKEYLRNYYGIPLDFIEVINDPYNLNSEIWKIPCTSHNFNYFKFNNEIKDDINIQSISYDFYSCSAY